RSDNIDFMGVGNPSSFNIIKENPYVFTITMGNKDVRMYGVNSFRPVIRGTIRMKRGLTVIDLKMRMFLFVRIFLAIWYCGVGIPFLAGLLSIIVKDVEGILMLFVSILFFASAQALSRIGFNFSAKNAISKLEELLK
ncbi:MAG: hypothetical protein K2J04_15345, partial [Lachnospiraceae bacterium]|nr:hypothetical protein [Lachnospiraceae bacterium]